MYQDIVSNQQKSEIDHFNGFVVKKGRAAGIECVTNEDIVGRIKELEAGNKNGR
jgi:ketopantoate reductase